MLCWVPHRSPSRAGRSQCSGSPATASSAGRPLLPGRPHHRVEPLDRRAYLAVGATVILRHPPPLFSRCFNADGEGVSVK